MILAEGGTGSGFGRPDAPVVTKILVRKNSYYDSVTLMSISTKVLALPGVAEAVVVMGTDHNKELLGNVGLLTAEAGAAEPNDLVVALKAADDQVLAAAAEAVEQLLTRRAASGEAQTEVAPRTIASARNRLPEANLALISVPGRYAAREATQALRNGLHVLLFSDNVSVEEEIGLKTCAAERGLLMMGPDCGTAIINNVALAFANVVRPGNIGVVGASGTGTQEVTSLIDRLGAGVSQVIGTGGRDLSPRVGGIMMLQGIRALGEDPSTAVVVLISKPPAPEVARKALSALKATGKPGVVCFIGGDPAMVEAEGLIAASNLHDAALKAVALSRSEEIKPFAWDPAWKLEEMASAEAARIASGQKYLRGLFSGGTLCDETMLILRREIGNIYSNTPLNPDFKIDGDRGFRHSAVDLGDDRFTVGRPHPMIDPTLRLDKLRQEASDPEAAVILLDVVIGYGSHPDPAGVLAPVIEEARRKAAESGRYLSVVTSVCGTARDPQNLDEQAAKLRQAGALVAPSNAAASRLAALIIKGLESR